MINARWMDLLVGRHFDTKTAILKLIQEEHIQIGAVQFEERIRGKFIREHFRLRVFYRFYRLTHFGEFWQYFSLNYTHTYSLYLTNRRALLMIMRPEWCQKKCVRVCVRACYCFWVYLAQMETSSIIASSFHRSQSNVFNRVLLMRHTTHSLGIFVSLELRLLKTGSPCDAAF